MRPRGGIAGEEFCFVLCARVAGGVSANEASAIVEVLSSAETSGWWFLNAGTIVAIFVTRYAGAERAETCREALEQLTCEHPSLGHIEVGVVEGPVIATFTDGGIIESMPLGAIVAEAMKKAMHAS